MSLNISLGHSRSLKVIGNGTIRGFVFAFHSNNGPILYHFRDKRHIGRKSRFFHRPTEPAFDAPVNRVAVEILSYGLERKKKLEWRGYQKSVSICLLVLTQYTNVTDGQTPHNGIGHAYA